ncbi:hypothetical protein [Streptomyces decoyicus]|uniref:hypothetical protein n=1 Tax=Streptomyces decoyicus TaxID=249567 RepID=UPI00386C484B|nr:hypothetical protein OG532_16755 [Streptomyces decoyicus]
MRDFIACMFIWLGEPVRRTLRTAYQRGRTWIASTPTPAPRPVLDDPPAYSARPLPEHVLARRVPIDGHEVRFVRPYYRVHEQARAAAQVRRIQTTQVRRIRVERRTAVALESLGIDYDPTLAVRIPA